MQKTYLKKYIAIVICLIGSFAVIALSAVVTYNFTLASQTADVATPGQRPENGDNTSGDSASSTDTPQRQALPSFNMLLLGLDDGILPDAMMILMFDGETYEIDVVSVPRDTRVILTEEEWALFEDINRTRNIPRHGWIKINEMAAYAGLTHAPRIVGGHLENMLGIEIDHYVIIEIDAFIDIVDAIGGIWMEIRPQGLFYSGRGPNDPGAINIAIEGGWQFLDGARAEQVVRFRQFPDGDVGRIRNQQAFMQAFFEQALTAEAVISNPGAFFNAFVRQVRTDWGVQDTFQYLSALDALDYDSVRFHMLPGFGEVMTNPAGRNYSYFFVDVAGARELIREIESGEIRQAQAE